MERVIQVCQLDLADLPVPLTKERALGLQTELWERFNTYEFQSKLTKFEKEHGLDSPMYRKMQQMLVLHVQSEVLPKYGYKASVDGVAEMRTEFQRFEADAEVSANREAINRLIGKSKDDSSWEWDPAALKPLAPRPGIGLPYPSKTAPRAASLERPPQHARRAHPLSPGLDLDGGSSPAAKGDGKLLMPSICQLDFDDITIPFERRQALGLQRELCEAFRAEGFRSQLRKCEEECGEGSAGFRKRQQQLVLGVQARVLPKYGFEGSMDGVAEMRTEIHQKFSDDAEIQANIHAINALIGKTWGAKGSEQGRALALLDVERSASDWARAPEVPTIRYETATAHVSSRDGYWVVTGGTKHGGLLVRLGEHMASKATGLLAFGAVVKEVQLINGRLCFEKASGKGPNYGWVSVRVKDVNLLERYEGGIPRIMKVIKEPAPENVLEAH